MDTVTPFVILVIIGVLFGVGVYYYRMDTSPIAENFDAKSVSEAVLRGDAVLLDVRTQKEREKKGYAVGSTHMAIDRLEGGELPDTSHDTPVYAHCAAGGRAERAKTILQEAGFTNVTNIGGLSDWKAAGGEVVRLD